MVPERVATRRRITALFICLTLLLCIASVAQSRSTQVSEEEFKRLAESGGFHYEIYKTTRAWNGTRRDPVLDTPFKRKFKTVLTEASKGRPDFDGKYVVASWGCGSECKSVAIIDIETGAISDNLTITAHYAYRIESSLFIADIDNPGHTRYYRWDGSRLSLLKPTREREEHLKSLITDPGR